MGDLARTGTGTRSGSTPIIVAHRGASWYAPENTIAAFDKAVALGADAMEFDVHLSRDGVPVVIHDDTLDATTDGAGPVAERTLAELRRLDAGSWFAPEFAGQPVPTLEEVLERYAGRIELFIELKSRDLDVAEKTVKLIGAYRCGASSLVASFHPPLAAEVKRLSPRQRVAVLSARPGREQIQEAAALEAYALGSALSMRDPEVPSLVGLIHGKGMKAMGWGMVMARELRLALAAGFDYIASDYPDQVRAFVERWKKEKVPRG